MSGLAKLSVFAAFALALSARAADETNFWPVWVHEDVVAPRKESKANWVLGPLFFDEPFASDINGDAVRARGFRPGFVETVGPDGMATQAYSFYPIFSYRRTTDGYRWNIFELITHYHTRDRATDPAQRGFDVWPFYFSRDTGSPESSYHALFPIYGTVKNRFSQHELSWFLFPIYGRFERNEVTTITAPWPFIKILSGEGNHGFALWPLFGYRAKAYTYRSQFYLWPLIYKSESKLWSPQPDVSEGFLPFYATTRNSDFHSETFLWPFFGYMDRVSPVHYHESDYFWPIWVQGRGDDRVVNRWGPFYTHSIVKGVDKTWILWPLWRDKKWDDPPLKQEQRQFFYFIYNETIQRSARNPSLPAARIAHYWPFVSIWDDGAGRKQIQAFSPFEVFFANNTGVRLSYSPIFALYRYNQTSPGHSRQSFLWNFITDRREPDHHELHVGPFFSHETENNQERSTIGNGLIAWEHSPESGWRISFFDFKHHTVNPAPTAPTR